MALAEDSSTPGLFFQGDNGNPCTTGSFTPPAGSLVLVMVSTTNTSGSTTHTVSSSDSATWSYLIHNYFHGSFDDKTYSIGWRFYETSPGAITVSASRNSPGGITHAMNVRVITDPDSTQAGSTLSVTTGPSGSISVLEGSLVYGISSVSGNGSHGTFTAVSGFETLDLKYINARVAGSHVYGKTTAVAGSDGSITVGWTNGNAASSAFAEVRKNPSTQKPTSDTASGTDAARVSPTAGGDAGAGTDPRPSVTAAVGPQDASSVSEPAALVAIRPSDASSVSESARVLVAAAQDVSSGSDAVLVDADVASADSGLAVDSALPSSLVEVADAGVGADVVSGVTAASADSVTVTDSAFLSYRDILAEDAAAGVDAVDQVVVAAGDASSVDELAGAANAAQSIDAGSVAAESAEVTVAPLDVAAATDSAFLSYRDLFAEDAAAGVDAVDAVVVAVGDTSSVGEFAGATTSASSSDAGAVSESALVIVHPVDASSGSDAVVPMDVDVASSDSGQVVESASVIVFPQELVSASDGVSGIRVPSADSIVGADFSDLHVVQDAGVDGGGATESATVIGFVNDAAAAVDSAVVFVEGVGLVGSRVVRVAAEVRSVALARGPHVLVVVPEARPELVEESVRVVGVVHTFFDPERLVRVEGE